jgi:uncharacterized protein YyaL (SSP411 family)
MQKNTAPNRLAKETSPYLLQHAYNPVDWFPWGDEAFQKAKTDDKPILLSCGYSACHWCHVMERESFEDPEIAALMNEYFVNIKVDREERPDIDQIYQQGVQTMTGQGGWPLTVFLDHTGKPFFGGTYFPPAPKYGRTSFPQILETLHQKWVQERERVQMAGEELYQYLNDGGFKAEDKRTLPAAALPLAAAKKLLRYFDSESGGFDHVPKFPNPGVLQLLLTIGVLDRQAEATEAVLFSLEQMARGGIYDQLGGGFHRYATDRYWVVPHFEKMLYDNAQLLKLYSIGYQLRPTAEFEQVVHETADYLRREMTDPQGGLYATQDADSEGVEGKYYTWSIAEVKEWLSGEAAEAVIEHFGLTEQGNFEGTNILYRPVRNHAKNDGSDSLEILNQARAKLLKLRETRVKPFRDNKIITAWNALAVSGFAYAYQVFQRDADYLSARKTLEFVLRHSRLADGRLARIYKEEARVEAMLDDYAFLGQGLLDMYETDFNQEWLEWCIRLTGEAQKRFGSEAGIYYLAPADGGQLVTRPVSRYDQAIPSGVSVHTGNLLRLSAYTGDEKWRREAERIFSAYTEGFEMEIRGHCGLIQQLDILNHDFREFVFLSDSKPPELLRRLREKYIPNRILAWGDPDKIDLQKHPARDLFQGRQAVNGTPTCYLCENQQCHPPLTRWQELEAQLDGSEA